MLSLFCTFALCTSLATAVFDEIDLPYTYDCRDGRCLRRKVISELEERHSLDTCKLRCSAGRTLWPRPNPLPKKMSDTLIRFCPGSIRLALSGSVGALQTRLINKQMQSLREVFEHHLDCISPNGTRADFVLTVALTDQPPRPRQRMMNYTIDESYTLHMTYDHYRRQFQLSINASNAYGNRHAIETLKQLIVYDVYLRCYATLDEVEMTDKPAYPYRGVMLDTSRNFFDVSSIKLLLDAMSLFKLNTFHWHITDSHSFPLYFKDQPEMAFYGAYNQESTYTKDDVADITKYAKTRGIRVIAEIDMPAHAGYGWQWGEKAGLGKLGLCVGMSPWQKYCLQPPCGQLNPINENVFVILSKLFREIVEATGSLFLHLGGDEVKLECWNATKEIWDYLRANGHDLSESTYEELWGNFTLKAYKTFREALRSYSDDERDTDNWEIPTAIYWSSSLTRGKHLRKYFDPETSIIMYWDNIEKGLGIEDILEAGIRVIFANSERSYLDCGYSSYVGDSHIWCSPYKNWTTIYENDYEEALKKLNITPDKYKHLVLGGEVALWTEVADQSSFLFKILPRMMASAERWWSFSKEPLDNEVWDRFEYVQMRFAERLGKKFRPDVVTPAWCVYNPKTCH